MEPRIWEFSYVWLKKNTESAHFFYCPVCQNPVLRYQGQVATIIPAGIHAMSVAIENLMDFPIEAKCTNKNCPAKYVFESFAF